jgi:hypothetical protein
MKSFWPESDACQFLLVSPRRASADRFGQQSPSRGDMPPFPIWRLLGSSPDTIVYLDVHKDRATGNLKPASETRLLSHKNKRASGSPALVTHHLQPPTRETCPSPSRKPQIVTGSSLFRRGSITIDLSCSEQAHCTHRSILQLRPSFLPVTLMRARGGFGLLIQPGP